MPHDATNPMPCSLQKLRYIIPCDAICHAMKYNPCNPCHVPPGGDTSPGRQRPCVRESKERLDTHILYKGYLNFRTEWYAMRCKTVSYGAVPSNAIPSPKMRWNALCPMQSNTMHCHVIISCDAVPCRATIYYQLLRYHARGRRARMILQR